MVLREGAADFLLLELFGHLLSFSAGLLHSVHKLVPFLMLVVQHQWRWLVHLLQPCRPPSVPLSILGWRSIAVIILRAILLLNQVVGLQSFLANANLIGIRSRCVVAAVRLLVELYLQLAVSLASADHRRLCVVFGIQAIFLFAVCLMGR